MTNDTWTLGGHEFHSRFILGSGKYSLDLIKAAVEQAGAEILTLALRRANSGALANILDYVPENVTLLPNTSGARNAEEAVRIARLARELCHTDFVKIEVIKDSKYLLPDNHETLKATEILAKEGFIVMPYMYPDLQSARDMRDAGAACIMPLGAPIGSNKGLCTKDFIQILINEIDLPIIVDEASANRHRPAKLWKWVQRQSWRTPRLPAPATCRSWPVPSAMQSTPAARLISQAAAVSATLPAQAPR